MILSTNQSFFIKNTKVIIIVEFKKHIANANIFGIIIGKFYYKKKPYLIILLEINKNSKLGFYYTILFFSLTISL